MATLLSDADVGFGRAPTLLSDADVGFRPAASASEATPEPASPASGPLPVARPGAAALGNAIAQLPTQIVGGLINGGGAMVASAGTAAKAGARNAESFTRAQLGVMDRVDAGEKVAPADDPLGYADASPDQRAAIRKDMDSAIAELPLPGDTELGQVGTAVKAVGDTIRRAGGSVTAAGEAAFPLTPEEQKKFSVRAVRAIGSLIPYLGAAAAGGLPAVIGVAGVNGFGADYDAAKQAGASDEDAAARGLLGGLTSAGLMTVPVGKAMQVAGSLPKALQGEFFGTLVEMAKSGATVTAFNQLQTVANNVIARATGEPGRDLMQGVGQDLGPSFVAGAIAPMAGAAMEAGANAARRAVETRPPTVADVLAATNVDSAASSAAALAAQPTQLAREQAAVAAMKARASGTPAINAPAFVPPGASVPALPRILQLIRSDDAVAAGRPEFVPPAAEQPPNPLTEPQPRTVPAAEIGAAAEPGAGAANGMNAAPADLSSAATPTDLVDQTASQIRAAQQAREQRLLLEPRIAGFDDSRYVPGETPLLHEIMGDPATSIEARQLIQDPKYVARFEAVKRANNDARTEFLNSIVGDATDIERLTAARDAQAQSDLAAAWETKSPVDAQPVADVISRILAGPSGKIDVVRTVLGRAENGLYDADGNLETDPEILYGVRKNIGTLLSKEGQRQEPMNQHAVGQLIEVRNALDEAISSGAPSFTQYLKNFAEASRPIDAMTVLQAKLGDVYSGANRNMTFNQFDNRLKQIVKMRATPGVNAAKSIPDEVMDSLFNLRASLARTTNEDLGRARGSDTAQNLRAGSLLGYNGLVPEVIAHGAAAMVTGGNPMANLMVRGGAALVKDIRNARLAKNKDALVEKHLNPGIDLHPVGAVAP